MVRTSPFHGKNTGSIPVGSILKNYYMDLIILKSFIPEIFLSVCIISQLVFNVYLITGLKYNFPLIFKEIFSQTFVLFVFVLVLLLNSKIEGFFSNFLFENNISNYYIKIIFIVSCLVVLSTLVRSFKFQKLNFFEYFTIFSLSIFSLLLLVSSNDMISAYLVIEMQALSFYVLASFRRNSAFSIESGLKYFISGSFISGLFLFGCSILYGTLGTLNFKALSLLLVFPLDQIYSQLNFFIFLGSLLITITLLFKLSVVPFHFWAPDVYEGAPLVSTIVFSVIPKFALFTFFIKWLSIILENIPQLQSILFVCGLLSAFVGTFFAISQKRMKRLFIYSSIAQGGFLITALSTNTFNSLIAIYFFLIIYIITAILIWSHFSLFHSFQNKISTFYKQNQSPLFLSSLINYFQINKLWSVSFIIIFFSIAGIPPLSGFLSKAFILISLIESKLFLGSFILILISAIATFYYLRVIKIIFFESKNVKLKNEQFQIVFNTPLLHFDCVLISISMFILLYTFFFPSLILLVCQSIIIDLF